jgi:hypothetical protein
MRLPADHLLRDTISWTTASSPVKLSLWFNTTFAILPDTDAAAVVGRDAKEHGTASAALVALSIAAARTSRIRLPLESLADIVVVRVAERIVAF